MRNVLAILLILFLGIIVLAADETDEGEKNIALLWDAADLATGILAVQNPLVACFACYALGIVCSSKKSIDSRSRPWARQR